MSEWFLDLRRRGCFGLFPVLPVPPFKKLWLMSVMGGVVDGTTKNIQHAPVHHHPFLPAMFDIQLLRILVSQTLNGSKTEIP